MSKVAYDLDSTGGLMDQIQKLISPPEDKSKKGSSAEANRRGGRIVAKEACDACGEGGDLLCCDRCFAAFHLLCHDPPLNEDDVPYGEWLCRQCKSVKFCHASASPADDAQSTTSSKSNRSNSVASAVSKQRGRKKNSNVLGRSTPDAPGQSVTPDNSNSTSVHLLSRLAKDWKNLNPREFSLPIKMVPNDLEPSAPIGNVNAPTEGPNNMVITSNNNKRQRISTYAATIAAAMVPAGSSSVAANSNSGNGNMGPPTPGGSKTSRRRSAMPIQTSGANYDHQLSVYHSSGPPPARKPILQADGNIVNLHPLILCYVCSKSCRSAPLLQCDYCPLAFHLDCLDTPLATFPSSPWMCPNHPEHYLDVVFAPESRQSLTKRIKLWRHYSAENIDDFNAIKLRFLNKLHRPEPPHRSKLKVVPAGSATLLAKIPQAIKDAYVAGVDPSFLRSIDQDESDYVTETPEVQTSFRKSLASFYHQSSLTRAAKGEPSKGPQTSVLASVVNAIMAVAEGKELPGDVISQSDSKTVLELAKQRLEQLAPLPSTDLVNDASTSLALKALLQMSNGRESMTSEDKLYEALKSVQQSSARAILVPLCKGEMPIPIASKTCSIGTSPNCTINLSMVAHNYGCKRLSPAHGIITYDETSDFFELLVYSEYGAMVDGVHYGVGLPATPSRSMFLSSSPERRQVATESPQPQISTIHIPESSCKCNMSEVDGDRIGASESPAILRHGSIIQMGCLRFVFSRILQSDIQRAVASELSVKTVKY